MSAKAQNECYERGHSQRGGKSVLRLSQLDWTIGSGPTLEFV